MKPYNLLIHELEEKQQQLKQQKNDKARAAYRQKHESDFIIADAAARYFSPSRTGRVLEDVYKRQGFKDTLLVGNGIALALQLVLMG